MLNNELEGDIMLSEIANLESGRRDAILNAALNEFATKGFDEASTNTIAKESGISKGLMLHYVKQFRYYFIINISSDILIM